MDQARASRVLTDLPDPEGFAARWNAALEAAPYLTQSLEDYLAQPTQEDAPFRRRVLVMPENADAPELVIPVLLAPRPHGFAIGAKKLATLRAPATYSSRPVRERAAVRPAEMLSTPTK